jgi:hypothetical protein
MPVKWLRCNVSKGMFSDERVIKISGDRSFFVHRDQTKEIEGDKGRVRVRVLRKGSAVWAIIPTEDATAIEVKKEELETA